MTASVDIEDIFAEPEPKREVKGVRVNAKIQKNPKINDSQRQARQNGIPGAASVWVKTFGCSHNQSDSEYMAGQLQAYGYRIVDDSQDADVWLVNTCTVKNPSQTAMANIIDRGKTLEKPLVVAGCVPQGDKKAKELEGLSVLGVTQIDRVVEAVEETLQGNTVQLLAKKELPRLDLPKVRRNRHIEIIPLSTGCLGSCTYCKTKHARGELGSYDPDAIVQRAQVAAQDPHVREIWLSSEDTGAYGRDIGIKLPSLLKRIVDVLPKDGRTRLRVGMTNPPFILDCLEEIAEILCHPLVFSYLHIPVQSGSDEVLLGMNREYTVAEFRRVADTLLELVPNMELATDIICGFPGETHEDHLGTMKLVEDYEFPHCHISQFYPRPGTPAARMKRVPTQIVKNRTRDVTKVVDSFSNVYQKLVGTTQQVAFVDWATDKKHLIGHTKTYAQVLVKADESFLGLVAHVRITKATRWCVFGEITDSSVKRDITADFKYNVGNDHDAPPKNHWNRLKDYNRQVLNLMTSNMGAFSGKLETLDMMLLLGIGVGIGGIALASMRMRSSQQS